PKLSARAGHSAIAELVERYGALRTSWGACYPNFGIHQSKAITELALRADPISQEILGRLLPQLERDEQERVAAASARFYQVARIADLLAILIFCASTMVAIAVAYSLSRHLTRGLGQLKQGAETIGAGNLEQMI